MQTKLRKIPVEEYTSHCPFTIGLETPYEEIVKIMQDHQIRHLPVVFEGRAIGIISERNLKLPVRLGEVVHLKAKDIMVSHPYKVKPKDLLQDVALEMSKNKIGSSNC